jgi:methylated-DNA-protein-cysteine methyltransferase related protein
MKLKARSISRLKPATAKTPVKRVRTFTESAKLTIKRIPRGRVATYGQVAALAGSPRGARQVVWILHSSSDKYGLPWHRVINVKGQISLPHGYGYELQKALLMKEKVAFDHTDTVDLKRFGWKPKGRAAIQR